MVIIKKYKYFFDFFNRQKNWLNKIASKDYKLRNVSGLSYTFEKCEANEYEYEIIFTEHLSEVEGKKLEEQLSSYGYNILKDSGAVSSFFYELKSLVDKFTIFTLTKCYENKFLIIEKRRDENLKTNINVSDALTHVKVTRNTYILYTMLLTGVFTHAFLQNEIRNNFMIFFIIIFIILGLIKTINCTTIINNLKICLLNKKII